MSDQLLLRGARLSLLLHGLVLSSIVYVATILPELAPPLIIDFSITSDCADGQLCNAAPEQTESVPEVLPPTPPVEERIAEETPEAVKKKIPAVKPREPEETIPRKSAVEKIVSVQAKKRMVVKDKPRKTEVKPAPEPITKVETTEVVPKEIDMPPHPSPPERSQKTNTIGSSGTPIANASQSAPSLPPKERYLKANFAFIREAIERNTSYPNIARRMGWQGKVLISFTVLADGMVKNIRVVESCGFKALDSSAINTVKRCTPFPRPPLEAEITLPITYRLN